MKTRRIIINADGFEMVAYNLRGVPQEPARFESDLSGFYSDEQIIAELAWWIGCNRSAIELIDID